MVILLAVVILFAGGYWVVQKIGDIRENRQNASLPGDLGFDSSQVSPIIERNLVWRVEPELAYGNIHFCDNCKAFTTERHRGYALDPVTGMVKMPCGGGLGDRGLMLLYDEKKNTFGYYGFVDGKMSFAMWPGAEYKEEVNRQYAYRLIDSDKVVVDRNEVFERDVYDLSEAFIGDKYALSYAIAFVTDFIYEDYRYNLKSNGDVERSAVKLNGKWGVVDINGNTIVPFCFDDMYFIDNETAFAKYKDKYGILDVNKTIETLMGGQGDR